LEEQVLQVVGGAVERRGLVPGADVRPDAEGRRADRGHGLGDDAQAAGERGPADRADAVLALDGGLGTGDGPPLRGGAGRRPGVTGRHLAASSFFSSPSSPSITGIRESLPRESISAISTWTFWPTPTTSSTFST